MRYRGTYENGPSLQRAYNPEGETDVLTCDNPVVTVIADDARRAPTREAQGQVVTTRAAWPRNYFRKSPVELL